MLSSCFKALFLLDHDNHVLDTFLLSLSIDLEIRLIYISIKSNVFAVSFADEDEPDLVLADLFFVELVWEQTEYYPFTSTEEVKEAVA